VQTALKLLPLVFVRSSELRYARWDEFDLDGAEWRIPAERMKRKIQHVVPLSRQAVAALKELYPYSGPEGFVTTSAQGLRSDFRVLISCNIVRIHRWMETMMASLVSSSGAID